MIILSAVDARRGLGRPAKAAGLVFLRGKRTGKKRILMPENPAVFRDKTVTFGIECNCLPVRFGVAGSILDG